MSGALTFTTRRLADTAQTVTVTGVFDDGVLGDRTARASSHAVAGGGYAGVPVADVVGDGGELRRLVLSDASRTVDTEADDPGRPACADGDGSRRRRDLDGAAAERAAGRRR